MTIIKTDQIAKKDDDKHLEAVQQASHTADFYQNQHEREAVTVKEVALVYISFIMVFLCLSNFATKKKAFIDLSPYGHVDCGADC